MKAAKQDLESSSWCCRAEPAAGNDKEPCNGREGTRCSERHQDHHMQVRGERSKGQRGGHLTPH